MNFLWISSYPRKGWQHVEVQDRKEGRTNCEWCDTEIRYAHVITHGELETIAGCDCAEKLTGDYVSPKAREKRAKSKAGKRHRFLNSKRWRQSEKGNYYRNDLDVLIWRDNHQWKVRVGTYWSSKVFKSPEDALPSIFEYLFAKGLL